MVTRAVKNPDDLALLKVYLDGRKRPFTVDVTDGRDRSGEQNRLSFKWYKEISEQSGEEVEDVRARCKLEIGVPILRAALEPFRKTYDAVLRPLDYQVKLEFIRDTDMPVTRLMSVEQMSRYMDLVFKRHAEIGFALTIPPDKYAFDPGAAEGGRLMRKLTPDEESALAILTRHGSYRPGSENDASRQLVRSVLDQLVRKERATVEETDDGPRYTAVPR